MIKISAVDSHTAGEPTRVILSGFPAAENLAPAVARELLTSHDHYRRAALLEPRGSEILVGAWLLSPIQPASTAGVVFFNNVGVLGMCGHGLIGLVVTLKHLGRINDGMHRIETPTGIVTANLEGNRVAFENVPSFRFAKGVQVGDTTGDIAYGGNWFYITANFEGELDKDNVPSLMDQSSALLDLLDQQNIRGANGAKIDHIEFSQRIGPNRYRNFVLCPGKQYDRSPCGTGTSAKLACLAADSALSPGQQITQESVIGTEFIGNYQPAADGKIIPTVSGEAWVTAELQLIVQEQDPFAWGRS